MRIGAGALTQVFGAPTGNTYTPRGDGTYNAIEINGGAIEQDATWPADPLFSYYVTGGVTVGATGGATLTLDPNTVMKFVTSAYLQIGASSGTTTGGLIGAGTIFTSYRDDTVGGDDNGDGSTSPSRGDWPGIIFENTTIDGSTSLTDCEIRYGGQNYFSTPAGVWISNASPTFTGCIVRDSGRHGVTLLGSSTAGFTDCDVYDNGVNTSYHGFYAQNYTGVLDGCEIRDNLGYGFYASDAVSAPVITNSTFSGNGRFPMRIGAGALPQVFGAPTGNTYTPRGDGIYNAIEINGGTVTESVTWPTSTDFPYYITGEIGVLGNAPAILKLVQGTVFKFALSTRLVVGASSGESAGGLDAEGATFTSYRDDSVSGDTNGDGVSAGSRGDWYGIFFENTTVDASSVLRKCAVRYAGRNWLGNDANIRLTNASPVIAGTQIDNSNRHGITMSGSAVRIDGSTIRDNSNHGVFAISSGGPAGAQINQNNILDNGGHGVWNNSSAVDTLNAESNWWGEASGPSGEGPGTGDEVSAGVDFDPWLGGPLVLDTTPPDAIIDLHVLAGSETFNSVTLRWTAPGDDGNGGTAFRYDVRFSEEPILFMEDFYAAQQAVGEPTPASAGNTQQFTVTGLGDSTHYFLALITLDEVLNPSGLSNVVEATTLMAVDIVPPSRVADLVAVSATAISVALEWTAPGDDDRVGTASSYDIRYATTPIETQADFDDATTVDGEPAPAPAGTRQSFVVTGLSPNTLYYLAIVVLDNADNASDLSGQATIRTLDDGAGKGDINDDSRVDIIDVMLVVNFILERSVPADSTEFARADINSDGGIDVLDVVGIVNRIIGRAKVLISAGAGEVDGTVSVALPQASVSSEGGVVLPLMIDTQKMIYGAQIHIRYDADALTAQEPGLSDRADGLQMACQRSADGTLTILVFSLDGTPLPGGAGVLLNLPFRFRGREEEIGSVHIETVIMADGRGGLIAPSIANREAVLKALPEAYHISQNHPNPFNPNTSIIFELPRESFVTLTIWNSQGQRIRTLASEHLSAGSHRSSWDARDDRGRRVASGTYFYRLTAGTYAHTRKMVLLR